MKVCWQEFSSLWSAILCVQMSAFLSACFLSQWSAKQDVFAAVHNANFSPNITGSLGCCSKAENDTNPSRLGSFVFTRFGSYSLLDLESYQGKYQGKWGENSSTEYKLQKKTIELAKTSVEPASFSTAWSNIVLLWYLGVRLLWVSFLALKMFCEVEERGKNHFQQHQNRVLFHECMFHNNWKLFTCKKTSCKQSSKDWPVCSLMFARGYSSEMHSLSWAVVYGLFYMWAPASPGSEWEHHHDVNVVVWLLAEKHWLWDFVTSF